MKTYKHLYAQIATFENLLRAFDKAKRHKRMNAYVAAFELDLEHHLLELERELQNETYTPGAYHNFNIHEPKERLVSAAPFRDRIVHHALCNVIEPIWEARFIHDSYACRKHKGMHRALARASEWAKQYRYALKCDITKFFPSIDHAVLLDILRGKIADTRALALIAKILASGEGILAREYAMHWFPGDDLFAVNRARGLPIGNLTSQFWANVYLNELDQFVKRELKCPAYLRYADDFLVFGDDKPALWAQFAAIQKFLGRLRLTTHPRKSTVMATRQGVAWLGFRVFPKQFSSLRPVLFASDRQCVALYRARAEVGGENTDPRSGAENFSAESCSVLRPVVTRQRATLGAGH
ncbi:MAG: group II intron reverse transcriptase domain-containing protein [Chloroflexi bacterium]|nr:group II intron reverse transcriptase domain-containing protein [Chloroflexota bacterium]